MTQKEKDFSLLIRDNQGLIIKVARMYTDTREDEEDLFQEIVLQLWRSIDSFKGDSKISTWMYRVAFNTSITLFRKTKSRPRTTDMEDPLPIPEDDSSKEKQERISLLYKAIKQLPDIEKALVMMYLDDLPYHDIALNLGITEVNARVKMNRLKKTLKKMMQHYDE